MAERWAVSKNFDLEVNNGIIEVITKPDGFKLGYTLETKILVYADRQKTWFFDIANRLKSNNEAGFVILLIATAYLEGNQQFREGQSSNHRSSAFTVQAVARIFQDFDASRLVDQLRHGLFHDGMTRNGIMLDASSANPISMDSAKFIINPHLFLAAIEADFDNYLRDLKSTNNLELRFNFERAWDRSKGFK